MSYQSTVLADSPSLLWMLQEASGTTAADATGNGHAGTYENSYTLGAAGPPGVASKAVTLSGGDIYLAALTLTSSMTVEGWFKTATASGGGLMLAAASNFDCYMANTGALVLATYNSSTSVTSSLSPGTYNDGAWHYFAATYSAVTQHQVLYADGAQVVSTANTGGVGSGGGATHNVWAGNGFNITSAWPVVTASNTLAGTVCAMAVYPVALTSAQVLAHYNAASGSPSPSGLLMAGII